MRSVYLPLGIFQWFECDRSNQKQYGSISRRPWTTKLWDVLDYEKLGTTNVVFSELKTAGKMAAGEEQS